MRKIMKQFRFKVMDQNNYEVVVCARIERIKKGYYWDISHFYKPSPIAGYYIPSARIEQTVARAEQQINAYISCLKDSGDYLRNVNY